ncbi:hypothetical protein DFJ58DRAFT_909912 [Suillus subalutaceus]|uniref:uncharacterized protein n=1 Tax=Suillus subalutaceus TaxID=48586 RepID=UPI001B86AF76|nr:uncharacterized protein DFJ58DRAFT_909912 [Suillus subalutaceus]KAG1875371.1 hypothetical protein DFJ58DRAFT_909912 [Suillus subalutaceus]
MSFYNGVVPADGPSAQTGINWLPHQQTQTTPQPLTTARATSNSINHVAPVTPAQAYARSVVSGQHVLQYTIERQQLEKPSGRQPEPNLQSPIGVSASTRGQSYAQRLYASSLSKQPQVQIQQQPTSRQPSSSGPGGSSSNRVPAGPRAPYSARASLMLNTAHTNAPQTVSAVDFYHSSVSNIDLQSPVPDRGTNSPRARRPQSATGSASGISVAHSLFPIQAPHGLQVPNRHSPVPVELSDGPPPSPAGDPRRSSQAGLLCRSPHSTTHVIPGSPALSDIHLQPESVNNVIAPPETPPREFSPYSEDYSGGPAHVAAITSDPESVIQPSDSLPAPIQTESLDVGASEEVPTYSLVDEEPPPPDFDESQSMCRASTYHAESPIVLAPPDLPSPTPHESDAVFEAVPSAGADTPSFAETTCTLSPEPLSGSPRTSLAMPEVASFPMEKAPENVMDKSYGYSAEDSILKFSEKSSSYPSMEASSSSRTLSEQVPSYRQPRYSTTPRDIPHLPISSAASPRNDTSAKTFSTAPPPALQPRGPVVSIPAPTTASVPPLTIPAPPPLNQKASAAKVEVRPGTSLPRPGSSHQPSSPTLLPRVRAGLTFPPSSTGTPPFIAASAGTTSQMYYTVSPSPLPSPPLSRRSLGPSVDSVLSASSIGSRPTEFRPQLSPNVSPTLQGQAPYQSSHQSFQPPAEFRPQLSLNVSPTLQGQAPYQSLRQSFQPPAEFRPQLSPAISPTPQGYAQAPYQSPDQNFQSQALPPPPPPQHASAQTSPAQPVQSSKGLDKNVAAGLAGGAVLGLLGGAVLAETLGGGDIIDDITGGMNGMTFGNPVDGLFDSNMGTGDILGSGFDPTANFQGGQMFAGNSSGQIFDTFNQTTGNGVDLSQFQGQSPQQPNVQSNQSSGTHYLHDAGQLMQAAYKMYKTSHQTDTAQGPQGSQTTAPLQQTLPSTVSGIPSAGCLPNSPPLGYAQTSYPSQTQQIGQSMHPMASQTAQPPFSQHYPSVNPASQQGTHPLSHLHASPQSSHTSHAQSPHINHVAYPSFGTATHIMSSQGPPISAQYAVNHGDGTAPHHAYSPQSQAGYSVHPAQYHAQGNSQQSPTGQQPPSAGAGIDKTVLAKQFVKGALMAGGVLAKYNRLSGGNGFVGNENGGFF